MSSFSFEVLHSSKLSRARAGRIATAHGSIDTPAFVPVATCATLKSVSLSALSELEIPLLFCNTYHLLLQPGCDQIASLGGLHRFMGREKGALITDSGGFQIFSLAYGGVTEELKSSGKRRRKSSVLQISEEGVLFRSYRDGCSLLLTPESSIVAQKQLGADLIVAFDELPPYHCTEEVLLSSLERTHRWEERSLQAHRRDRRGQALYAVIHGGLNRVLRKKSCDFLTALPFDGYAIGGSLGKTRREMIELLRDLMPLLPANCPNHLLGIGDLDSLPRCIALGIDSCDSAYPTQCARHGTLLTFQGKVRIGNRQYRSNRSPVEEGCPCPTCMQHTLAYLHHLFKAREITGQILATVHNLYFMQRWMADIREKILNDEF